MEKAIAYYSINLYTSIEILDTDDGGERIYYRINDGKKHFSKIYYNNSGEPFFIDQAFTNSRIYLNECLKTSF